MDEQRSLCDVAICMPIAPTGSVHVDTAHFAAHCVSRGAEWITFNGPYIHANREMLVRLALQRGRPYIFWLDSDVVPPPECIDRLLAHGRDIVAAPYVCLVNQPHERPRLFWTAQRLGRPNWMSWSDLPPALFQAYVVGTGALLMRADVFDRIERPWFDVPLTTGDPTAEVESEDVYLCRLLRQAGFEIYCDGSIQCDHVKLASIGQVYEAARDERFCLSMGARR